LNIVCQVTLHDSGISELNSVNLTALIPELSTTPLNYRVDSIAISPNQRYSFSSSILSSLSISYDIFPSLTIRCSFMVVAVGQLSAVNAVLKEYLYVISLTPVMGQVCIACCVLLMRAAYCVLRATHWVLRNARCIHNTFYLGCKQCASTATCIQTYGQLQLPRHTPWQ
jgi:hypothetical protein